MQTDISMRGLWLIYISYLMGSIVLFGWYDRTTVKALLNPTRDRVGNMIFVADGVAVYPFTVAAALVGVLLSVYYVWRRLGGVAGLLLGVLVGRASVLSLFELYEFTFVGFGAVFHGWEAWEENYGKGVEWTLLKMSYVSSVAPLVSRRGVLRALATFSAAIALFLLWVFTGYHLPESGDAIGYALNAATRILYALTPAIALRG
ncbi:MAG: hypothetical protein RQ798_01385 [Candidatus Caldarchaeales archaeon]|nr:hypothetical protein [Candidatus Caldarchaeales archaeon]MDT7915169.1 hypothetical protein [Candidatus Caldarchaeales archaeon]